MSTIAVEQNADGRLEVFAIKSGGLHHKWQTSPNGSWSSWASLGLGDIVGNRFAAGRNADGRLEVFARNNQSILTHAGQTTPGSNSWSGWASIGSGIGFSDLTEMTVVENADGRLEVFAYGFVPGTTDAGLIHTGQTSPNGSWSNWDSLHGDIRGDPFAADRNADGRLEMFAYGKAPNAPQPGLIHVWQITPGGNSWSGWSPLGGSLHDQPGVGVGRNADGRLEVFAVRTGGDMVHKAQSSPNNGWLWDWASLGGELTNDYFSTPVIGHNADGRLEVFVIDRFGNLHHKWQTAAGGSWATDWATEVPPEALTGVAVGCNADGRLEVFAHGSMFAKHFHKSQTAPGSNSWSDWAGFD